LAQLGVSRFLGSSEFLGAAELKIEKLKTEITRCDGTGIVQGVEESSSRHVVRGAIRVARDARAARFQFSVFNFQLSGSSSSLVRGAIRVAHDARAA
jgi:hypothetical protein